jgi:excisionase family DNA binding protein
MRQSKRQAHKKVNSDEPLQPLLTMTDVCTLLKLSRPMIYILIDQGLPIIKFGRAIRFSPTSLQRWLAGREEIA